MLVKPGSAAGDAQRQFDSSLSVLDYSVKVLCGIRPERLEDVSLNSAYRQLEEDGQMPVNLQPTLQCPSILIDNIGFTINRLIYKSTY